MIAVVGSINLDVVVGVERHPAPGETVVGGDRMELPGGKGANQAVAAARLGATVGFVGRVGDDDAGRRLRDGLAGEGIDVAHVLVDPEAAEVVFASGVPLTMVGLNLTHQAQATADVVERLRALGTPVSEATIGWLSFFADSYREIFGFGGPPVHDPCALALVIDPSIVRCEHVFVAIETEGRWTRGATVVDLHGRLGREPNARVAMQLDVARFWDLVIEAIAAL